MLSDDLLRAAENANKAMQLRNLIHRRRPSDEGVYLKRNQQPEFIFRPTTTDEKQKPTHAKVRLQGKLHGLFEKDRVMKRTFSELQMKRYPLNKASGSKASLSELLEKI